MTNYREVKLACPICGAWIATVILDKNNKVIHSATSSDFVEIDKPCRSCREEQNDNSRNN